MSDRKGNLTTRPTTLWPYPDIVKMSAHVGSGQWRKRHNGRDYYFGVLSDPDTALARWRLDWPSIISGKERVGTTPALSPSASTGFHDAARGFLETKLAAHDRGELAWSSYREYKDVCKVIAEAIGRTYPVGAIGPVQFTKIMEGIGHLSPIKRSNTVTKIKTILRAIGKRHGVVIEFPDDFRGAPAKLKRRQRHDRGNRTFTPAQIRKLIDKADPTMKALVLLGINGGYGNNDAASLEARHIDLKRGWIEHLREKTQAHRRVPLWPETMLALKAIIKRDQQYVFVNERGQRLVRPHDNDICGMMTSLTKAAEVVGTFYWLRYTFATKAAEVADDHARHIIMGHVIDGVPEGYVLKFPAKRLKRLTDHIHKWLFKNPSVDQTTPPAADAEVLVEPAQPEDAAIP